MTSRRRAQWRLRRRRAGKGPLALDQGVHVAVLVAVLSAVLSLTVAGFATWGNTVNILTAAAGLGLIAAIAMGLINGLLVAYADIPPIFVTLASSLFFLGVFRLFLFEGTMNFTFPESTSIIATIGFGRWLGIPVSAVLWLGLAFLLWWLSIRTAGRFIDRFRIRAVSPKAKVVELSGGNQQKVVLAKSLTREPKVVIFDEPTRGVDVGAITEIHELIREFRNMGAAVIIISSYLPEVMALSDRILVARNGRIAAEFRPEEATEEKIMFAAVH